MLASLISRYRLWRLKNEAIETLHDFDDRQLRDLGTFRDSIELFVAERAAVDLKQKAQPKARYRAGATDANLTTRKRVTS